jgi:hypothetical protein
MRNMRADGAPFSFSPLKLSVVAQRRRAASMQTRQGGWPVGAGPAEERGGRGPGGTGPALPVIEPGSEGLA